MATTFPLPDHLRFSRTDYYRMADAGIISPDVRVELLDGEIFKMSPIGPGHSAVVAMLDRQLQSLVGDRAICRVQCPVALDDFSEPEPDLVLVRPRADFYRHGHPTHRDILLIVEVADSSHNVDLGRKLRLYAKAGIVDYWVFDLIGDRLIVHRDPVGEGYQSVVEYDASAKVSLLAFPDVVIDLRTILSH